MAKRIRSEYEKKAIAKRNKAIREERIQNKQCTKCGEQDNRTLAGFTMCTVCNEKQRARSRKYRASEYGKYMNTLRHKETNAKLKELGICIGCHNNDAEPGHAYCKACIEKYTAYNHTYLKRKKEKENGRKN
jgi:hypothetical protein